MNRLTFFLLAFLVPVAESPAQDWARARLEKSPRHGEWVKVRNGKRDVQSFLVFPEVKDKAAAVVVIHEIFGLTDWVRGVADQLAEAGYIAIAPDLLSGIGPKGGGTSDLGGDDAVRKAIMSLPPDQITADLNAVVDHVAKLPACNGKIAVAGFCGGNDARVNATIPKSAESMKKAAKTYEPVTYDGAGHGFMRAGEAPDANAPNKKARNDAWTRWKELLKKI